MERRTIGLLVAGLGVGITIYLLRSGEPGAPPAAQVAAQPVTAGPLQDLNEAQVRMTPPSASIPAEKPADGAATRPGSSVPPPALGREFEPFLSTNAPMKALHEEFQREPREEPWATLMEGKWYTAFAENPELLAYGTPDVHCRTTRCEVRLVTYKPSTLDQTGWFQVVTRGAGKRTDGEQSVPLVTGIRNSLLGNIENDGARVILYYYEYGRSPPAAR